MIIFYNESDLIKEIKEFAKELNIQFERKLTFHEYLSNYQGPPIGFAPPQALVDISNYVFAFLLGSISSGVTYDVVKIALKKMTQKIFTSEISKNEYCLIFDGADVNDYCKNTYFFISRKSNYNIAIDSAFELINKLKELNKIVKIDGSLRFYFETDTWILKKMFKSDDLSP